MDGSKTWPMRAWRRVSFAVLTSGAAALVLAGLASPTKFGWS